MSSAKFCDNPQSSEQTVKHADADHEIALAADGVAEPPGDGQNDAVSDEIGGQRPRRFIIGRRKLAGDMRQRHIDDGGVEDLHERRHSDNDGDQPRIELWCPGGAAIAGLARCSPTHWAAVSLI